MQKKFRTILSAILVTLSLGTMTACDDFVSNLENVIPGAGDFLENLLPEVEGSEESEDAGDDGKTEVDTGYAVTGMTAGKLTVGSDTQTLTFQDVVTVNEGFTYSVHTDVNGMTTAIETVELRFGENVFYVVVKGNDYQESNKLTVYRKQTFVVTFDLNGGSGNFENVQVEEGEKLSIPETEPTRAGFEFDGWNYNFATPVTKSFTVKANWKQVPVKYAVRIEQTDDAQSFVTNDTLSAEYEGYAGSTVYATVPTIDGYLYVESESEYSGEIQADGSLELVLRFYKLVEVTGEVVVPQGDKSLTAVVYNDSGEFYQTFDEIENGKIAIRLDAPVSTSENTLKVKALGYSDVEEFVVGNSDVTFDLIPQTYDFGAFTLNEMSYQSAKVDVATATTSAAGTDQSTDWNKIATDNGVILQARGRSHALLFSHFAETEYAVGATVHTFTSTYSSGTLGTSYSSRSGGFVVATAHDQMHVLITDKGSIWIGFGYLSEDNDVPNGELYIKGNSAKAFVAYNPSEGAMPTTASGGYEMTLVRKNNVFTLYVGGIKYLTLDSENGAVGYEHLASVTPTYVAGSTTDNEAKFKTRLAHFLGDKTANAVGFTTFRKTIDSAKGYTAAVFSDYQRTTDVDGVIAMQEQIRANAKKIVKSVTLNGKTLNSNQLNANVLRYASTTKTAQFVAEKATNVWIYDTEGKDLYCTYQTTTNLTTNNTVYMNDIQAKNFTFTFKGALAYRQGFVITDGTNRVAFVGESTADSDLIRLCHDDNANSTFLKGQGIKDENTVWKIVVTKNEKIEIYLTNATTGNVEKLAITITKDTLTTHVGTLNDGTTTLTNHNILGNVKGLLESTELACGFTFTTKSKDRPSLTKIFKDIAITAN